MKLLESSGKNTSYSLLALFLTVLSSISQAQVLWVPYVYFTPETNLAGGVLAIQQIGEMKQGRASEARYFATFTQNKQTLVSLFPQIYFDENKSRVDFRFFYQEFPQYFYGIGNDVTPDKRILYDVLENQISFSYTRNVATDLYTSVGVFRGASKIQKVDEESTFSDLRATISSRKQQTLVHSISIGINHDSRDFPNSPTRGAFHEFKYSLFQDQDSFNWSRADWDYRKYFEIGSDRTLALQTAASAIEEVAVDFDQNLKLGGPKFLRGYYQGRLRGRFTSLVQLELRAPLDEKWAYSAFTNLGYVSGTLKDIGKGRAFPSLGGGIHYFLNKERRTKGRLDIGFSDEGPSFYLVMDDSF